MRQTNYEQPTREPNVLTIGCRSMEIEPSAFVNSSYPKGVCIKILGYNPESIIIQLLDDYGYEKLTEMVRQFATHSETFKSITVAAAEKNAVRNLEVMLGTLALLQRSAKLVTPNNFISLAIAELSKAIEDSTPKE